jgi:uncharacterized protein YjbJ (UPF0337 family)
MNPPLLYDFLIIKREEMNRIKVNGNWNEQKGILKQRFASLTENDLLFAEGKKDEMLGKLQIKLGKTREELHKIIEAL